MKQKTKQLIMTLVALLALTTHAWADDKKVVLKVDPITVANGSEAEIEVKMDYTTEKTLVGLSFSLYLPDGILLRGFDTKEAQDAAKASALKKACDLGEEGIWGADVSSGWLAVKSQVDGGLQITLIDQDDKTPFVKTHAPVISVWVHAVADVSNVNGTINGITLTDNENNSVEQGNIADVLIPFNATAQEPESSVPLTWDATAKTATLTNGMPAGNVTVSVEYYPQATTAEGAVTAADGVKATTEDALVTIDKSKLTGVTKLMYFVSTKATAPDYDTDGWTDVLPTAANYTEAADLNVWYYAVGADSDDPAKTYSDGDICAKALTVTLGAAPLWNAEFDLTDAPEEDKAGKWSTDIPEGGVKKGTEVKVTYTGTKKILGVKAEKKVATKVLYSWESPAGTVSQTGGTIAYVNGDGERLNYVQGGYNTICLNGKKTNINDETASVNAGKMVITLDEALVAGDVISFTAFINKNETKNSSAYFFFEKGGEIESAYFSDAANIDQTFGGSPQTVTVIVPAEADGSKTITMTRGQTGTNLFITKLEIIRGAANN